MGHAFSASLRGEQRLVQAGGWVGDGDNIAPVLVEFENPAQRARGLVFISFNFSRESRYI